MVIFFVRREASPPSSRILGPGMIAGAALNAALFVGCIGLVYSITLRLLQDDLGAALAVGLFALLPPFAGCLFVVYPEIVVTFVFLLGIAWLLRGGGTVHAARFAAS